MRHLLALLLIVPFVSAGGGKDAVVLPLAFAKLKEVPAALPVHLSRTGRLTLDMTELASEYDEIKAMLKTQGNSTRTEANLDLLDTYFDNGQKMYGAMRLAAKDRKKWPEKIGVVIHADKEAPWLHVGYILQVCAQHKMRNVWFAVETTPTKRHSAVDNYLLGRLNGLGRAYVPAFLPEEKTKLDPMPREPADVLMLPVQIIAKTEEFRMRDDRRVAMPTQFRFRAAGRDVKTVTGLDKIIADMKRAAGKKMTIECQLTAGQKTPIKYVVAALNRLHGAGFKSIDYLPAARMRLSTRELFRLGYPRSNLPLPLQSEQKLDPEEEEGVEVEVKDK